MVKNNKKASRMKQNKDKETETVERRLHVWSLFHVDGSSSTSSSWLQMITTGVILLILLFVFLDILNITLFGKSMGSILYTLLSKNPLMFFLGKVLLFPFLFYFLFIVANTIITNILMPFRPKNKAKSLEITNAGKYIGILERLLMLLFLLNAQYSGLAFILGIKGFARYKEIGENPQFAEYFTIGTFLSVCITLLTVVCLKYMLSVYNLQFIPFI